MSLRAGDYTLAQRLLKSTVDRYLSPKDGRTTTISLPLFSGLCATLHRGQAALSRGQPQTATCGAS